ncbi:MAG: hypothetical protein ACXWMF_10425, partial [Syntrophales bacterium]
MKKKTIIYGNGEYAHQVHQKLAEEEILDIVAFTADRQFMREDTFRGLPLVAFEDVDKMYPPDEFGMLVVIAFSMMRNREIMFAKAKKRGYRLENFIASRAIIHNDLDIGENNIIHGGVYLGPFGRLGDNNVIRPNTYIGHGFKIHSHNYIAPGCNIGGECEIKGLSFIGIGSTVVDSTTIERETFIGA